MQNPMHTLNLNGILIVCNYSAALGKSTFSPFSALAPANIAGQALKGKKAENDRSPLRAGAKPGIFVRQMRSAE
jgi:hypothetical protein